MTKIRAPVSAPRRHSASVDRRHGEHVGATAQRGLGALEHAVAIAVRLDDGAQLRPAFEPHPQVSDVRCDRAEVDSGDGALHGSSRPAGRASMTSLAITDSAAPTRSAAARPAFVFAHTPAHAASNGSSP